MYTLVVYIVYCCGRNILTKNNKTDDNQLGGGGFFRELYTSSRPPAPDAPSSGEATKVGTSQFRPNCVFVYIPTFYMFVFMVTSSQCAVDL